MTEVIENDVKIYNTFMYTMFFLISVTLSIYRPNDFYEFREFRDNLHKK